jgi:ribosome-binding protein aMBF1 (putative translation factor)
MRKCPVCGWEIKDKGVEVKVGIKPVTVCCAECADKLRKENAPAKKR